MNKLVVGGAAVLEGSVDIAGAKNSALPILLATVLSSGKVTLRNVPILRDTTTVLELLNKLGAEITVSEDSSLEIDTSKIENFRADYDLVKTMRASILVLGPLLAKYGSAYVSLPGGCAIGSRPVDLHLFGLERLGADITLSEGYVNAAVDGRLTGNSVNFDVVSVGATENIMMAATLAEGITVIDGAATEPEVSDLANFLVAMGAKISGIGSSRLVIEGVKSLHGCDYSVIPDRIEAGTYLIAAAMTRGSVTVNNVNPAHLDIVLDMLKNIGAVINCTSDSITLDMQGRRPKAKSISTGPYPYFPTDLQAQWLALSTVSSGKCLIEENIFENRFMHVHEMKRMGADIRLQGNSAEVFGKDSLSGAKVMATDLRASASLVLAALVADGETTIDRIYHIDRGYTYLEEKFMSLGATIKRI